MSGSLFERLTMGKTGFALDDDESIRRNLSRIFTTRQGAVQADPYYGLPDLNDLTLSKSELVARTCESIADGITKYEPRLREPEVESLPMTDDSPFTLKFSISASRVNQDGTLTPWRWDFGLKRDKIQDAS